MRSFALVLLAYAALGCGSSSQVFQPTGSNAEEGVIEGERPEGSQPAAAPQGAKAGPQWADQDAPEISRSRGQAGGIVVLWPRIAPKASAGEAKDLAVNVQGRLRGIAEKIAPGKVDMRPEPERSCPKLDGCEATAVSAVLAKNGKVCALVATVSRPGKSPQKLHAWVGNVKFKTPEVPFREPPESALLVDDFQSCDKVLDLMSGKEKEIEAAIREGM